MSSLNGKDILAKPYVPIDTDLVDDIEHYATDKIHVVIHYQDRDASQKTMRGLIADVYTTQDHEEYLKMADGRTLRLDQLVKVEIVEASKPLAKDSEIDLEEKLKIKTSRFFPNGLS